jgi:ADP-ribose pyrophosphatase
MSASAGPRSGLMSAKIVDGRITDDRADAVVAAPELLAKGFRPYQRLRFTIADDPTPRTADILRAGAAAAVLPVDPARGEIVLLRQFRLAAHLANGKGSLVEIVAGHVEAGEQPTETARRECIEEIGVAPDPLIPLFSYFTTPGMSDEEITLFLGIVDASRVPARAGLAAEHELTLLTRMPINAALAALEGGVIHNGPLIVALHWLALNRSRLPEIVRNGSV